MADIDPSGLISLLIAASTDQKKNDRMEEIQKEIANLDAARAKFEAAKENQQIDLTQALGAREDATKILTLAETRSAGLDAREAKMAEVQQAIQAEHQKWEMEVRQPTDAAHKDREIILAHREETVTAREQKVEDREHALVARETEADQQMDTYHGMVTELSDVIAKHNVSRGTPGTGVGLDPVG
jgi:chromosome segregation ATPase